MTEKKHLRLLASSAFLGLALVAFGAMSQKAEAQASGCGLNSGSLCSEVETCTMVGLVRKCGTRYTYYAPVENEVQPDP
jgi:hypothetical protein